MIASAFTDLSRQLCLIIPGGAQGARLDGALKTWSNGDLPPLAGGLEMDDLLSPFQPKPFYDSLILRPCFSEGCMKHCCTAVFIVILWVFILNRMRNPKDEIFDLQCWRYFQHISSDSSRCLGCSASLLKSSLMLSILQLSCLWKWKWKDIENPRSRAEHFCDLYLLEPDAFGLFAAQARFTEGFPNFLLTTEKTKAARPSNFYTSLYLCSCTWDVCLSNRICVFFPVVYLSCRDMWSLVW